jgi:hypothetical protein
MHIGIGGQDAIQKNTRVLYRAGKALLAVLIKGVVFLGSPPGCSILTCKSIPQFSKRDVQSFQPVLMVNNPEEFMR